MNRETLSNRKCEWKKQSARAQLKTERVHIKARAGEVLTLGEVYSVGHELNKLGMKGVQLAKQAALLGMADRVIEDIGNECHFIEQCSQGLRSLLYKRRMYASTFPLFESPLQYTIPTEPDDLDPMEELKLILTKGEHE